MTCQRHPQVLSSAPYCFDRVKEQARQRCIDKGEGWRWGYDDNGNDYGSWKARQRAKGEGDG